MTRVLHTADWQLGMMFPGHGAASGRLAEARFEVVGRLLEIARARRADLVVVAGDVFDSSHLAAGRLRRVLSAFGELAPVPVVLLPGNHDPDVPGGIWDHPAWDDAPSNVIRLREAAPLALESPAVTLLPCPLRSAHGMSDPTAWLHSLPREPGRIRIAVAHGALPVGEGSQHHPVDVAAAAAACDYLALGDWHSVKPLERDGRVVGAYPGTPEPTRFGERESGTALLVELDGPGAEPRLEVLEAARVRWLSWRRRVDGRADLEALEARVRSLPSPDRVMLELRLEGAPSLEVLAALDAFEATMADRLLGLRVVRDGLRVRAEPAEIAELAPDGPLGVALEWIAQGLSDSDSTRRRVAEEALRLYHELSAG